MSNTEQVSLDEMIARHEPPAELQDEVEKAFSDIAQNIANGRKPRSDKGMKKPPKLVKEAPPQPGTISAHQASELKRRAEVMMAAAHKLAEAERENQRRTEEYYAFIDSLTITN